MNLTRRRFIGYSATLLAGPSISSSMPHIILLGDSVFDNTSYTGGKPDVITHVKNMLPTGWRATLLAVDGATTEGIAKQLARLPLDASQLVLSIGGNNALARSGILDKPAGSTAVAFDMLGEAAHEFEAAYRKAVAACMKYRLPLVLCTIYNGNFSDLQFQRRAATALAVFNDAIIRVAAENKLPVIELRKVCDKPEDYANPIEPSSIGSAKIAKALIAVVTGSGNPGYQTRISA